MPGINISTAVRTGPSVTLFNAASQAFFVGKAQRGPSAEAVLILSLEQFESTFGGYQTGNLLYPTVEAFFEEGGTRCVGGKVRVENGTITSVFLQFNDNSYELMEKKFYNAKKYKLV